jgi:hypothetical protein
MQGASVAAVAASRGIKLGTVLEYLAAGVEAGLLTGCRKLPLPSQVSAKAQLSACLFRCNTIGSDKLRWGPLRLYFGLAAGPHRC